MARTTRLRDQKVFGYTTSWALQAYRLEGSSKRRGQPPAENRNLIPTRPSNLEDSRRTGENRLTLVLMPFSPGRQ